MPERRAIPVAVKRAVRERQSGLCGCNENCGEKLPPDGKGLVEYQHTPPLALREINADGTDWIPPQHSADHILAEVKACHRRETYHPRSKATSVGSDRHAIDKVKRIRGETKTRPKRKWGKRKMAKRINPWRKKA